jgi:PAS domain S-box-containing protein
MNLRTKTFFIITAIFLTAFIIMAFLLRSLIMGGYSQEENQLTRDKILQARSSLDDALNILGNLAKERACQDNAYQFMLDRNTVFTETEINELTFLSHQLNLIAYLDISGEVAFARAYDLNNEKLVSLPDSLKTYFMSENPLVSRGENDSGIKGIISFPENILLVATHPILTSRGSGPALGTLALGRYLETAQLKEMPGISNLNITGYRVNYTPLPDDFRQALMEIKNGEITYVQVLDKHRIAGYTLCNDINGQPAYILRIDTARVLYSHAANDVYYFSVSLFAFGLLFIMVILIILEKMVISRITKLSIRVNAIGRKGDLSARVNLSGRDEIANLATNINGMLDNIELSRRLQKESETFNYVLLQDSPNPIEVMNADFSIRYVNPAMEKITGYSQTQLIGRKPPFPWWTNENTQEFIQKLLRATEKGVQKTEKQYQKPDGSPFWVEITTTAIKQGSEIQFYIANWVDITERKQTEKALKESEKRFRELAELLPELVFETDLEARLTFVNRVVFSVFGYIQEEYSRLCLIDLIAPEDKAIAEQVIRMLISGEEIDNREFMAIRKDRTLFPALIHATPIKNNLGNVTGLRGILVDITRQKQIEAELRASEKFSSSLSDNSPYPLMVINPDATIRFVNAALEDLSGFSSAELVGCKPPYPFWDPERAQAYLEGLTRNMFSSHREETLFRKKSGESFFVDVTSTPIVEDSKIRYVLSIWVDITAQKMASEQLENLYQREKHLREALQAEIRSRAEFTRSLVHELKTPLTPIMASSELLVEELTEEPLLGLARNVRQGAENMNRRVDELLDLARGEVGMLKVNINPVDPHKLLNEVVKYMEPAAQSNNQTLSINLPAKLPIIMADDDRVRQILVNLINNSIKYSPPGGQIHVTARQEGEYLIIEVQDTGRGMSEEEQKRLFQPYYRIEGKEHLSGLGLGLALSRWLVELQNGRIWVKSQKGVGSIFSFSLPIRAVASARKNSP